MEKQQFFGVYYGTMIKRYEAYDITYIIHENIDDSYIELKPLSSISDEDVVELSKHIIHRQEKPLYRESYYEWHKRTKDKEIIDYVKAFCVNTVYYDEITLGGWDYLRSKGYALPYLGITVEEQVKRGWIKLV